MTIFRFSALVGAAFTFAVCAFAPIIAQGIADDGTRLVRADLQLNRIYQLRIKQLAPAKRAMLRGSERRWISETTRRCERVANRAANEATVMGPGAAAQAAETLCRLEETEKRIVVLRNWKSKK